MRKAFSCLGRLIALASVVLLVVTTVLALFLFNVQQQLLGPDLYKHALAEERFYERLPGLAAAQIVYSQTYNPCVENPESEECRGEGRGEEGAERPVGEPAEGPAEGPQERPKEDEGGPPEYFRHLTREDYAGIISDLLPPAYLQAQTESALDQLFAYLESTDEELALIVSTVEFRERLRGQEGMNAVMRVIDSLPPCTGEQRDEVSEPDPEGGVGEMLGELPRCKPTTEELEDLIPWIRDTLNRIAGGIEDETDLAAAPKEDEQGPMEEPPSPPEGGVPLQEDPRMLLGLIRLIMRASTLLPFGFLLSISLFAVNSWRGWFRWWSIPLLVAGLLGLGLAFAGQPVLDQVIDTYLVQRIPGGFAPEMVDAVLDLARAAAGELLLWVGGEALVVALGGLALLVLSLVIRENEGEFVPLDAGAPVTG